MENWLYIDPGRPLEADGDGNASVGVDFASSGLNCTITTISCDKCEVSSVRQYCQAASLSKSSRRPGNGAPALIFLRHI